MNRETYNQLLRALILQVDDVATGSTHLTYYSDIRSLVAKHCTDLENERAEKLALELYDECWRAISQARRNEGPYETCFGTILGKYGITPPLSKEDQFESVRKTVLARIRTGQVDGGLVGRMLIGPLHDVDGADFLAWLLEDE